MNVQEFDIPVPWGHIAVKAWGNERNTPVLLFHGMGDNAGSFDQLIPHLPTTLYYICIDLPGHGKSSHFPKYTPLYPVNIVFAYKLIVDYLKREKYIIIAHSWGARTAALFTQLYPDYVLKLTLLDAVYLQPLSINSFQQYVVNQIDQIIEINDVLLNKSRPTYSYEEALKRLQESRAHGQTLDKEAAVSLLRRSLIATGNGRYCFSTDIRLRSLAMSLLHDKIFVHSLIINLPITCPMLIIMASESSGRFKPYASIISRMQKSNNKCFVRKVEGDHDLHMKQPQVIAKLISIFLEQSKL